MMRGIFKRPVAPSLLSAAREATRLREVLPQELTGWVRQAVEGQRRDLFLRCLTVAALVFLVACLALAWWLLRGPQHP